MPLVAAALLGCEHTLAADLIPTRAVRSLSQEPVHVDEPGRITVIEENDALVPYLGAPVKHSDGWYTQGFQANYLSTLLRAQPLTGFFRPLTQIAIRHARAVLKSSSDKISLRLSMCGSIRPPVGPPLCRLGSTPDWVGIRRQPVPRSTISNCKSASLAQPPWASKCRMPSIACFAWRPRRVGRFS